MVCIEVFILGVCNTSKSESRSTSWFKCTPTRSTMNYELWSVLRIYQQSNVLTMVPGTRYLTGVLSRSLLFYVWDPIRFHQNDASTYVTVIIYCETSCRIFLKASEIWMAEKIRNLCCSLLSMLVLMRMPSLLSRITATNSNSCVFY